MRTLNPNNRNPKNGIKYEDVADLLLQANEEGSQFVGVGNNTVAEWVSETEDENFIAVTFFDTKIANLIDDDTVQLFDGGYKNAMTKKRLDWVLLPLGYRMTKIRSTWKVYHIATGSYRDYFAGMVVTRQ